MKNTLSPNLFTQGRSNVVKFWIQNVHKKNGLRPNAYLQAMFIILFHINFTLAHKANTIHAYTFQSTKSGEKWPYGRMHSRRDLSTNFMPKIHKLAHNCITRHNPRLTCKFARQSSSKTCIYSSWKSKKVKTNKNPKNPRLNPRAYPS